MIDFKKIAILIFAMFIAGCNKSRVKNATGNNVNRDVMALALSSSSSVSVISNEALVDNVIVGSIDWHAVKH